MFSMWTFSHSSVQCCAMCHFFLSIGLAAENQQVDVMPLVWKTPRCLFYSDLCSIQIHFSFFLYRSLTNTGLNVSDLLSISQVHFLFWRECIQASCKLKMELSCQHKLYLEYSLDVTVYLCACVFYFPLHLFSYEYLQMILKGTLKYFLK